MHQFIVHFSGLPGDDDAAPDPTLPAQQVFAFAMRQMPEAHSGAAT